MAEKTLYQGKYLKVTEERLNGHIWERAYIPEGVLIFPVDQEGRILIIEEVRPHETPPVRWKPITGFVENPTDFYGEVNRELQEEVKLKATSFDCFLDMNSSGTLNTRTRAVLCWELTPSALPNPDGDVIRNTKAVSLEELVNRTLSGELEKGIASYCFLKLAEEKRRQLRDALLKKLDSHFIPTQPGSKNEI